MDLLSANFTVDAIDKDGRKFDNVSRIFCHNENNDSELILDVAIRIYPIAVGDVLGFVLSHEISQKRQVESQHWHPSELANSNAYKYDYVMHGKTYRYEEDSAHHKATVFVSFGGLLMSLSGEQNALKDIPGGRLAVYLMIRKIK
jgi:DNA-directed RNA polymerase I, II, and III subunit RPABC3